jgi:hypothetical protein
LSKFSAFTFEAWIKLDTYDDQACIFTKPHDEFESPPFNMYGLSVGKIGESNTGCSVTTGGERQQCFGAVDSIRPSEWYYVAGTWNGESLQNYVNGVASGSPSPKSGTIEENNEDLEIGYFTGGWLGDYDLNGIIDELRISNIARSVVWIKASYESERDHLINFGVEEVNTEGSSWLSGWEKRVKITIDQNDVDSDLSNFPLLVHLSSSSGWNSDDVTFIFNEISDNSEKIALTQSDGVTEYFVEIEQWDPEKKEA